MKYHVISTSRTGHGAVFTNLKDPKGYKKERPISTYSVFDQMPSKITDRFRTSKRLGDESSPSLYKVYSSG